MQRFYVLFFLSGSAGLIYQVVWSRLLHEIFGVTIYAVTTVLATFLAGLALGSIVLGRKADRSGNPLRLYGWLEIGIGVAGLAGTWLVGALEPIHIAAADRFGPASAALIGTRGLLAALVVLPPTFLMGGTLPVVTRFLVRRLPQLGRELGFLYALNTLGAVVGSLAAGFFLIRAIGLHPTLWVAVALNLAVGAVALALSAGTSAVRPEKAEDVRSKSPDSKPVSSTFRTGLLLVMMLSGFASLGLEVLWTRVLILIVGTSTYAFVTMLSSFLAGITLGSFVARTFVDRVGNLRSVFGWIQVGIAASALLTVPILERVNTGDAQLWLEGFSSGWFSLISVRFGISFLLMLVPTTLIGMTFPIAGKMYAQRAQSVGGEVGALYGANTFGNILGAVLGGFVLLPVFGIQKGIALLTVLNLIAAAWALFPSAAGRRPLVTVLRAAPVVLILGAAALTLLLWTPRPFTLKGESLGDPVIYYREGVVSTVKVIQRAHDAAQRWLAVDGVKIGESVGGVDAKQQALAHFPFLLLPDGPPRHVLSIGLGTGILIGEVSRHSGIESIDCLEISPSVIEASRYFDEFNHRMAENPIVRIINDDGVNFLRRIDKRYGAIISDAKSRTAHAGNSLFFSRDYYQLCFDHLEKTGLMIQWVPLAVPPSELRVILHTFLDVFPHAYLWLEPPGSCFLVGTLDPLVLDLAHIDRVLAAPPSANLRRYGWRDGHDFISLLVADDRAMREWLGQDVPVNSLETPVLEFYSPKAYATPKLQRRAENVAAMGRLSEASPLDIVVTGADPERLRRKRRAVTEVARGFALLTGPDPTRIPDALQLFTDATETAPEHGVLRHAVAAAFFDLGLSYQAQGQAGAALEQYRKATAINPEHAETQNNLGSLLASIGEFEEATSHFQEALRINPKFGGAHTNFGNVLAMQGRGSLALSHFSAALEIAPDSPSAHRNLGVALVLAGQVEVGFRHLREAQQIRPTWAAPLVALAWTLATYPDSRFIDGERAIELALQAEGLTREGHPIVLDTLAAAYASAGRYEDAVATAERARARALSAGNSRLARAIEGRVVLYRARQPFREQQPQAMLERLRAPFPRR